MRMYNTTGNVGDLISSYIAAYRACFVQCMTIHFYTGLARRIHFQYRTGTENTFLIQGNSISLHPLFLCSTILIMIPVQVG